MRTSTCRPLCQVLRPFITAPGTGHARDPSRRAGLAVAAAGGGRSTERAHTTTVCLWDCGREWRRRGGDRRKRLSPRAIKEAAWPHSVVSSRASTPPTIAVFLERRGLSSTPRFSAATMPSRIPPCLRRLLRRGLAHQHRRPPPHRGLLRLDRPRRHRHQPAAARCANPPYGNSSTPEPGARGGLPQRFSFGGLPASAAPDSPSARPYPAARPKRPSPAGSFGHGRDQWQRHKRPGCRPRSGHFGGIHAAPVNGRCSDKDACAPRGRAAEATEEGSPEHRGRPRAAAGPGP